MAIQGRQQKYSLPLALAMAMGMAGNPVVVFRRLLMSSPPLPPELIQFYHQELQAHHYARRMVGGATCWSAVEISARFRNYSAIYK